MKPQDIEKIANVVVGAMAGARDAGLLGCGSLSSTQSYSAAPDEICTPLYYCGGRGAFSCSSGFTCEGFSCPPPEPFTCGGTFTCEPLLQFFALPCVEPFGG